MTRREHATILNDVLLALEEAGEETYLVLNTSRLAARANLAFDRLQLYLGELSSLGLVVLGHPASLTLAGREYLARFHEWSRVQEKFGLLRTTERADPAQAAVVRADVQPSV